MSIQLDLTNDQGLYRETAARFIDAELPRSRTREWHERPDGFDPGWLAKSAELGWFSMLVAEEDGGGSVSDNPLADAALVAELLGSHVQPGPFVPMNVALGSCSRHLAAERRSALLPAAVAGEQVVTWAWADDHGGWDLGAGVTVEPSGAGHLLSGSRGNVAEAAQAGWLLVTATLEGEPVQVLVPTDAPGVTVEPLAALDLARRFASVRLDAVEVPADAVLRGGSDELWRLHRQAAVLNAAETVGAMDELFTMTVEYAKSRTAFGRPIGSFQALKHLMADLALSVEVAKAAASAAIDAVGLDREDAPEVAAMAAAAVGEAGNELAQHCLQIHGGIGYTWEHDLHLLMRRIQSNAALYGTPSWHREQLCRLHQLGEEVTA